MVKDPDVVTESYNRLVFKFGRVDAHEHVVIWDGGDTVALYPGWLAAEAACEVISDNAADKPTGGAATKCQVWGQGDDGLEITEIITLNADVAAVGGDAPRLRLAGCSPVQTGALKAGWTGGGAFSRQTALWSTGAPRDPLSA